MSEKKIFGRFVGCYCPFNDLPYEQSFLLKRLKIKNTHRQLFLSKSVNQTAFLVFFPQLSFVLDTV